MIAAAIIAHALGGQREGRGWGCRCPLHNGRSLTLPRTSRRKDLAGTARALEFGAFPSAAPGFLEVFIARAEARALLCAACEVTLHDAVDQLQLAAERDGLLAKVGQDEVQRIMGAAFARVRDLRSATNCGSSFDAETFWDAPGWREAAQQYHANPPSPPDRQTIERARRLLDDNVSLERSWHEVNARPGRAAEATVEALLLSLRDGIDALSQLDTLRRLSGLDDAQLRAVVIRLQQFKAKIAQPWTPEQVEILLAVRTKLHER